MFMTVLSKAAYTTEWIFTAEGTLLLESWFETGFGLNITRQHHHSHSKFEYHEMDNESQTYHRSPRVTPGHGVSQVVPHIPKKRKLSESSSSPADSNVPLNEPIDTGVCNMGKVHAAVQCPPHSAVKRTRTHLNHMNKKELNLLRVQIAMMSDSDGDR
ncbi:hypothetical protein CEXT_593311 [Caerostris extrusa]|uniref:Uncharacterized protein n=1 Tax=Caerostris extrusa TaxID=172846 RepID=A0AAV4Y9P0_CAEEX|nr:hypothetical protein CEXT_593311 [Caerostris extrusa]